jgi:hypothetical protein
MISIETFHQAYSMYQQFLVRGEIRWREKGAIQSGIIEALSQRGIMTIRVKNGESIYMRYEEHQS